MGLGAAVRPPILAVAGVAAILGSTAVYSYGQGLIQVITPEVSTYFARVAGAYFLILLIGITMVVLDAGRFVRGRIRKVLEEGKVPLSPGWMIPYVLSTERHRRYFLASASAFAFLYAIVTSMIVYQPSVDFVRDYGVSVPSAMIGPFGQPLYAPVLYVYLVNHLGLLLIPLTLLLLLATSALVGLNFALTAFAFDNRAGAGRGWVGGLGAVVALFTGCPTCAGLFFASVLGGSGAVAFASIVALYQPVFILLSIPVLLGTPYLISRSLSKVFKEGCVVIQDVPKAKPSSDSHFL
ncbi:MAG: hypothetical protein HY297_03975 [Thaumarchaeota archaeon]|nr:hypothetical protein [Nitrososphaerota archaeon]